MNVWMSKKQLKIVSDLVLEALERTNFTNEELDTLLDDLNCHVIGCKRVVRRGQLHLNGKIFSAKELENYDDNTVLVIADPDNADNVDEVSVFYQNKFVCVATCVKLGVSLQCHLDRTHIDEEGYLSPMEKGRIEREFRANNGSKS